MTKREEIMVKLMRVLDRCTESDLDKISLLLDNAILAQSQGMPKDSSGFGDSCIIQVNRKG